MVAKPDKSLGGNMSKTPSVANKKTACDSIGDTFNTSGVAITPISLAFLSPIERDIFRPGLPLSQKYTQAQLSSLSTNYYIYNIYITYYFQPSTITLPFIFLILVASMIWLGLWSLVSAATSPLWNMTPLLSPQLALNTRLHCKSTSSTHSVDPLSLSSTSELFSSSSVSKND